MLVTMSTTPAITTQSGGYCFHCAQEVDGDIRDHFAQKHQRVASKPKVKIKAWKDRLTDIVQAIEEIREESHIDTRIQRLDKEVIEELYLVRASLTQSKRRAAQKKG